jgi:lipoyl(octanoyl) transferase
MSLWYVRQWGTVPYQIVWKAMQAFTDARDAESADEIWLVQHPPVFTQGIAGKPEHVLDAGDIPLVQSDRGGQVTYHGPGQLVAYLLLDLRRLGLGVRELVTRLELAIIALLAEYCVAAAGDRDAPGVYVEGRKIAALGLRVRRGCTFHGLSFNVDMDLAPFARINPCGHQGLNVTQLSEFIKPDSATVERQLVRHLTDILGYNTAVWSTAAGCAAKDEGSFYE